LYENDYGTLQNALISEEWKFLHGQTRYFSSPAYSLKKTAVSPVLNTRNTQLGIKLLF